MPLVSVIMPVVNEAENIVATIKAAERQYSPEQVEIIVVDGDSTDDTCALIPPHIHVIHSPRGRGLQMNRGAAESHGDILVFCHGDSQLPNGWREAVIQALDNPAVSGGTFQTRILPAFGILKWRNNWVLPPNWKIMFGDQVQFMRSSTFDQVQGYREIPLMEDVEMSRALDQAGTIVRIDPKYRVITSSRRFQERGVLQQSILNTINMIRYLYFGATPEDIARSYRSSGEEEHI
ncbi:MAG: TIGR04283 family arsenosugar biosynthesis glycosyltransferase [Anaerolineae bacterium]|nr:TIGR04283 family arsenosugar biosynthesis glycosyltransferase [Anaerolineae bacterium]